MNNLQYIVKDNTRFAMHMAVELCEQGDFDSVTEAFRWLMQERYDATPRSGTCELDYDRHCSNCGVCVHEAAVLVRKTLEGGTWTVVHKPASYCPNCGAKIRKTVKR